MLILNSKDKEEKLGNHFKNMHTFDHFKNMTLISISICFTCKHTIFFVTISIIIIIINYYYYYYG